MRLIDADEIRIKPDFIFYGVCGTPVIRCEDLARIINDMPTIQPETHWIPVTERLPENNDPVNVTWVNHNPEVYYMDIKGKPFTATAHYHRGHWYWYSSVTQDNLDEYGIWTPDLVDKDVEITAWMPLPEPYREGKNDIIRSN